MIEQNRFRSPVLWGAVIAQILSLLVTIGVIDTGMSEAIDAVVVAILELMTVFGVLNNPTNRSGM